MRDPKRPRRLRLPWRDDPADDYPELMEEFLHNIELNVQKAYPAVEPPPAFRDALHQRLVAEAAWLKEHPAESPGEVAIKRTGVAAAVLILLGLALVIWRSNRPQPRAAGLA